MGELQRLRSRRDFVRVQQSGKRFKSRSTAMLIAAGGSSARVGLTVSRKVGNAVTRNRVRRRLRELVRKHQESMCPGFDYVIIAYTLAADISFDDLDKDLTWLLMQARTWASRRDSSSPRSPPTG